MKEKSVQGLFLVECIPGQERMHPDDFEALLAWVNAKRSCHISERAVWGNPGAFH